VWTTGFVLAFFFFLIDSPLPRFRKSSLAILLLLRVGFFLSTRSLRRFSPVSPSGHPDPFAFLLNEFFPADYNSPFLPPVSDERFSFLPVARFLLFPRPIRRSSSQGITLRCDSVPPLLPGWFPSPLSKGQCPLFPVVWRPSCFEPVTDVFFRQQWELIGISLLPHPCRFGTSLSVSFRRFALCSFAFRPSQPVLLAFR